MINIIGDQPTQAKGKHHSSQYHYYVLSSCDRVISIVGTLERNGSCYVMPQNMANIIILLLLLAMEQQNQNRNHKSQ